jgi:hypothetical protein
MGGQCARDHAVSIDTQNPEPRNHAILWAFSARPLPSGVTACGVLWVRPGDPNDLEGVIQLCLFKPCHPCISVMAITVARDFTLCLRFSKRGATLRLLGEDGEDDPSCPEVWLKLWSAGWGRMAAWP